MNDNMNNNNIGWSTCKNGAFIRGFFRTGPNRAHRNWLRELEEARCCRPNNAPEQWDQCYNANVGRSWDNTGWFNCNNGYEKYLDFWPLTKTSALENFESFSLFLILASE